MQGVGICGPALRGRASVTTFIVLLIHRFTPPPPAGDKPGKGFKKKLATGVGSVKNGDSLYLVGACSVHSARHSVSIFARTRTATHATPGFFPCRWFGASQAATAPTAKQILKKDSTPWYSHSTPQGDPLHGVHS
jgi:hypothetical protein